MRRLLHDHDVLIAERGIDGLALWEPSVDVALIDYSLNVDMTGLQVAAYLRAKDPRLRIVVMGGDLPDVLPYPRLDKPFSTDQLRAAISDFRL